MLWVAKEHAPLAAIFTALVVGIVTALSTGTIALEPEVPPALSCFDSLSSTIRVTTATQCQPPLISLGSAPIVESTTADGSITELHPLLLARFNAAASSAALAGIDLYITSGFRNQERQSVLFEEAIKKYGSETEAAKWVLPPQFSHHPHGLAIDVNYPGDRAGAAWLEANGSRFGLCRVYANEWWHFEGVIAPGGVCPEMAPNALVDMR